jgi:FixJ family two-component response regulator
LPGPLQSSLPTWLGSALVGRDSHPLDDFSEFHEVIARSFLTSRAWSQRSTSTSERPRESGAIENWDTTPGMSGTEFLSRVRQSHPNVMRIALTGESDLGRTTKFIRDAELYWVLSKPVQREELLRTLERAMNVKRLAEDGARLCGDGKGLPP